MFDENFEKFRGQCLEEMAEKNERVLKHFFFRINYKGIVGYKNIGRVFTVWTDRPSIIIGKGGQNINVLKEILKEEFGYDYEIDIKEIKGEMLVIV